MTRVIDGVVDVTPVEPRPAVAGFVEPPMLLVKRRTAAPAGVPAGMHAGTLGIAVDQHHLYATLFHNPPDKPKGSPVEGHLLVLDKRTLAEVARIGVGWTPRAVAIDPGRRRAYVMNWGVENNPTSHSLSVVDLSTRTEIARLPLPAGLGDVAVNTKRNRIYVTGWAAQRLHVIDGATLTEMAPVMLGPGPTCVAVDESTGLIYVTRSYHSGLGLPDTDALAVIDGSTDAHPVLATHHLAHRTQPRDVRTRGEFIFVGAVITAGMLPHIAVFERTGTTLTRQPDLPTRGVVTALDVAPKSAILYNVAHGTLRAVRTDTGIETGALKPVGPSPQSVVVDPETGVVYVGHGLDGTISRHLPLPELDEFNVERHLGLVDEPVLVAPGIWDMGPGIPSDKLPPQPTNINAADTTNADQIRIGGSLDLGLDGSGVTVGIWEANDDGGDGWQVRTSHQEFGDRASLDPDDATNEGTAAFSPHATHVAGTIAAAGIDPTAGGMAPGARIISFSAADEIAEMGVAADGDLSQAVVISNHSHGLRIGWDRVTERNGDGDLITLNYWRGRYGDAEERRFGRYGNEARELDVLLDSRPHLLSVWSAGNERGGRFTNAQGDNTFMIEFRSDPQLPGLTWTERRFYKVSTDVVPAPAPDGNSGAGFDLLSTRQTAKNSLVVGAIDDVLRDPASTQDVRLAGFSSGGPTDDGRVKPDVVANGVDLYSTMPEADDAYNDSDNLKSGTSMSAPNVAGSAALLVQHHRNLFNSTPTSARLKAIMIHTAMDVRHNGQAGPDYTYGWGLMNAAAAATFLSKAAAKEPDVMLETRDYVGQTPHALTFESDGIGFLKATLVWTDPAPPDNQPNEVDTPASTYRALVHDLDLRLVAPDGAVHHPWTLDPTLPHQPATRDKANHVDNVEQVVVLGPPAGTWQVVVDNTGLLTKLQQYTVVVSRESLPPVFYEGGLDWGQSTATSIAFGDVDNDGLMEIGVTRTAVTGARWFVFDDAEHGFALLSSGGYDWPPEVDATSIAFGDIDNDGHAEMGITTNADTNSSWLIYDWTGSGMSLIHEGGAEWGPGKHATSIAFGDVDNDDRDEIGVVRKSDNGPSWFVYDPSNNFAEMHHGGEDWGDDEFATSIAFGDVDGDGKDEVGLTRRTDNSTSWLVYDDALAGFGLLVEGGDEWGEGREATMIAFGDVDNDDAAEIGVVRRSDSGASYFVYDDASGDYAELLHGGHDWGDDRYAVSIGFGDIDGDGLDELAVGRISDDGPRYYIRDDADHQFSFLDTQGHGWGDGRFPVCFAFGDIDGDTAEEMGIARFSRSGPRFYLLG